MSQTDLFGAPAKTAALPEGFRYQLELIAPREEQTLLDRTRELPFRGSVYLLSGPARTEWEHSIPEVDTLRYSVTFRNFREDRPGQ